MNRKSPSALVLAILMCLGACSPPNPENIPLSAFDYESRRSSSCIASEPKTKAVRSNTETLTGGHKFSVRTPSNYDPSYQHPLIIVYSPARQRRFRTEASSGLTTAATQAGFVVAYVDSLRLSVSNIKLLSKVPAQIAAKWCIDQTRIYLTGHSDGGTVANAIAFLPGMSFRPKAIAPSAAGIRGEDMLGRTCPPALSVMTWQNSADELFPGYGRELTTWWAKCNQCTTDTETLSKQCGVHKNCKNNVEVAICENLGSHRDWPDGHLQILEFFSRH